MKKRMIAALFCAGLLAFGPVSDVTATLPGGGTACALDLTVEEDGVDVSDGKIETFAELEAAVEQGGEYTLLDDIELDKNFTLSGVTLKNGTDSLVYIKQMGIRWRWKKALPWTG